MHRFLAILTLLFPWSLAFAETAEAPIESAGMGGVIGFLVVCALMTFAFFWYMKQGAAKDETAKPGEEK